MARSSRVEPLLHLNHTQLAALTTGPIQPAIALPPTALTVCLWFYAPSARPTAPSGAEAAPQPDAARVLVLVNHGHRRYDEPGWSIYLHEGVLVVSLHAARGVLQHATPLRTFDRWRHLCAVIDPHAGALTTYLDGTRFHADGEARPLTPHAEIAQQADLVVGGYTDAAGGHFDYTFGRHASNLGRQDRLEGQDRLDDLRIYAGELSECEIAAFYTPPAAAPHVDFTLNASNRRAPTDVRLTAAPADRPLVAHWWHLGDGSQATGAQVEHGYAYAGRYVVRLTAMDGTHSQAVAQHILELDGAPPPVRFTPVFVNGEEGYAAFRIPAIARAANGDLVAFAEGRVESVSDSTRTIRIVCKRSRDQGRTWGALQVAGRHVCAGEEYAAMNPSPVVDEVRGTGRMVLLYKQLAASEWEVVQGASRARTACVTSDDHGVSWGEPRDITDAVQGGPDWRIQIPAAGHAIQLRGVADKPWLRGRLFFSGSHTVGDDGVFHQQNYAFWSDDLGESWRVGPTIARRADGSSAQGLNEAMAVELADGRILINSRNYQNEAPVGCRAVTMGEFDMQDQLHFAPTVHDAALMEPPAQASILRYRHAERDCLLFSNPAHGSARVNLTVRASFDSGASWPIAKVIDGGPSAYSDLVMQTDGDIGVLYERGNRGGIVYAAFTYSWLTGA